MIGDPDQGTFIQRPISTSTLGAHAMITDWMGEKKRLLYSGQQSTVEPLYNTIVFHQNTHKRHPIARP